jgi:hypothetical protein
MSKYEPTYEQLEAFYHAVVNLTLNHDVITIPGTGFDTDEESAVVYPLKLGAELEKVDPKWYENG